MADDIRREPTLDVEGLLFRAALLSGYGREARSLARRFAAITAQGQARSCLDAGAPLQLTVDAPGPAGLRVGVRLGDHPTPDALSGLVAPAATDRLLSFLHPLPEATHASLGSWLFWTPSRQSIFVDLRDPSPQDAFRRLDRVLDATQRGRLAQVRRHMTQARPWVLRLEAQGASLTRVHVHWLLDRHASPMQLAEAIAPGAWPRTVDTLSALLRTPGGTGRWVLVTPLDDDSSPALRVGNSGWTIVPEDDRKHRAVGSLMQALGGPRDYAEALWSLCRSAATPEWRVGRACEVRVDTRDGSVRARLFLTPQVALTATPPASAREADDEG